MVAIAADILGNILFLEPESKVKEFPFPSWKNEPRAFERICNIVEDVLVSHEVSRRSRHPDFKNSPTAKAMTKGSGLLHYLVYCPRLELREQAFKFAQKLLQGDTSMETAADRQTDSYGVRLSPFVNVNEDLSVSDLKSWNTDREMPDMISRMETPLHMAVSVHSKKMVWLLLQYGADPEKVGRSGLTPYGLAKRLVEWEKIVAIIEKYQGKGLMQGNCLSWSWWSEFRNLTWAEGSKLQAEWIAQMERYKDNDGV
jgi:hypothetical protein